MKYSTLILILIISMNFNLHSSNYSFNENTETVLITTASVMGLAVQMSRGEYEPLTEYKIEELMKKELLGINRFAVQNYNDNTALVSDILLGICLAVPAIQIFDERVKPEWGIYGLMYLETGMLSVGTTQIVKNIFQQPRPYIYNPDVPIEMKMTKDARQSFFSGHSCLAFAGMTFFAESYSKYYPDNSNHNIIWLGSMSLAATTALLRVLSGRHFPVDILIGSAVGFAVGKIIPHLHESRNAQIPNEFINNRIIAISFNL
ncbi:MAG: phosphatase PAP2 family protein [Candidatus Kapabacteria bacterium]|nr:phosphatase PAP2 family protein [Ignavibacteriota bacterium]MCW5883666.1 phosphatase PAP2 family protein [Candidatus Kapabacteria bacterium]